MYFYSSRELEILLIFTLLTSIFLGINHVIIGYILNQDEIVFYQIEFLFNFLKFFLLAGYSFYVSANWRNLRWTKAVLILVLVISLSILCSLQMKIVTEDGISFSNLINKKDKYYDEVSEVPIKDEKTPFTSRISYKIIFNDGSKLKYFDPLNIHNGERVQFLDSKIYRYKPKYEVETIRQLVYKYLLDYEKRLINLH